MNQAISFDRSLRGSRESSVDPKYWDTVLDLYEKRQYKEALVGIIHYVNPELAEKTGNADRTRFSIPHGSAMVHLELDDNFLRVRAPFLSTASANKIPLLRQVAQINFSPLNLARIVLENDQLLFSYQCPLELAEPYKMYEVFREICVYADSYDDEFIRKFDASWIQEPIIERYSKEYIDNAWNKIQEYIKEAQAYIEYFENKRNFSFCWDVLNITLMKIEYYAEPQGLYRNEIEKTMAFLQSAVPVMDRVNRGKEFLRKLQSWNRADFDKDMYKIQSFIPYKYRSTLENIRSNFEESYSAAKKERDAGDHIGATFSMQYIFLKLFYYNNVNAEFGDPIALAMEKASGKPWHEASGYLWKAMEIIMTGEFNANTSNKKKGFFRSLFGK
ncbi:MAG: hypothetical protein SF052_19140 [Bacteroidia bacterium]|nr:hypothetical protein [Bacteroidia bacterium]